MPPNETSPLLGGDEIRYNSDNTGHPEIQSGTKVSNVESDVENAPVNGNVSEDDPNVPKIPGVKLAWVVPAMAVGIFLSAMDNTIVVASYGRIGTELNELNRTSWLSTAYVKMLPPQVLRLRTDNL